MSVVLEQWKYTAAAPVSALVLPDGCRDLIIWRTRGGRPKRFVTDLAAGPDYVPIAAGDDFTGFRLRPDVGIDVPALLAHICEDADDRMIRERLHDFAAPLPQLAETLAALASGISSVRAGAALLGVRLRSMQRLLKRETGRTPVFWLRLARVRQAAARLAAPEQQGGSLAELAYACGYADQAHMTREFRHWFGTTPHRIGADRDWMTQNFVTGYGA